MSTPSGPADQPSTPRDGDAIRVVCVAYNPGPELAEFAASLRTATTRPVTLVLADNGDDPTVVDDVASREGAVVLRAGRNLGYGSAANRGARDGDEPWVVVANTDIVWHPGALDVLVDAAHRHPRGGSFGPAVLNTDGTRYPSARALPSFTSGVGHAVLGRVWPDNPWTRAYRSDAASQDERPAGWLSGSCLLLRREAFEEVGGFDEGYFMFFEDVDLGERLGRRGWVNVHVPSAAVTHVGGTSWRERPAPMIRAHHRSAARYVARHYPHAYQWPLRVAARLGLRVREAWETRAVGPEDTDR
ncbi:glycosyltransferase family 2 protein [Actinotalea sp. AC32]|nr:glycosyltransferase family 2 protein [Actinotalea sp. AC32]